jgi:hypothetical protein
LPEAPGGVALRTIMSRDGPVAPPAAPASASNGNRSSGVTAWVAIGKVSTAARSSPKVATTVVTAHAVGKQAAHQHAGGRPHDEYDQAERGIVLAEPEHLDPGRHGELLDTDRVGGDQCEVNHAEQDRRLREHGEHRLTACRPAAAWSLTR